MTRRNLTDDDDTAIPGEPIDSIETVESDGRGVAPTRENADIARDEAEDGAFGSASAPASVTNASSSSSDWETDEEKDDSAVPDPLVSLFDAHVSETVAENLEYMRRTHGFVVPYAGSLADPEASSRICEKITRRRQCLFCRRRFATLEGVRGHMRDAGHVRVRFEPPAVFRGDPLFDEAIARANADGYRPEYSEFYDFGDAPDAVSNAVRYPTMRRTTTRRRTKHLSQRVCSTLAAWAGAWSSFCATRAGAPSSSATARSAGTTSRSSATITWRGCAADERRVAARGAGGAVGRGARGTNRPTPARRGRCGSLCAGARRRSRRSSPPRRSSRTTRRVARSCTTGARAAAGSHYHTAGSKQFLKGARVKGVVSRHSKQGAKTQAARVQAARNKQNRGNASVAVLRSGTRKG